MLNFFGPTYSVDRRLLRKIAKAIFEYLRSDFEVNLRFVSANKIKELNQIYRHKDEVTDVLSFETDPESSGGDIVICYQEVRSQAKSRECDISHTAASLLTHGILHLAGYEHTRASGRAKMEKAEEKILAKTRIKSER